jgi:hypothetical protein
VRGGETSFRQPAARRAPPAFGWQQARGPAHLSISQVAARPGRRRAEKPYPPRDFMRLTRISSFPLAALCVCVPAQLRAQQQHRPLPQQQAASNAAAAATAAVDPADVWGRFVVKETEFQRAFTRYAYRRDVVFQSVGMGRQVTGEYHRLSRISFDAAGAQHERVIDMPVPTLAPSDTDLDDLNTLQLHVLEAAKLPRYDFKYVGRERVDEIDTYIYDVTPKAMPDPKKSKERYFQGRVWIDDKDFQLVKARGRGVPSGKEVFPTFDYYREHDGRYWVPSRVTADDDAVMPSGRVLRLRVRVRYTDHQVVADGTKN